MMQVDKRAKKINPWTSPRDLNEEDTRVVIGKVALAAVGIAFVGCFAYGHLKAFTEWLKTMTKR